MNLNETDYFFVRTIRDCTVECRRKISYKTFLPIIDILDAYYRSESYKEGNKSFSFVSQLKTIDSDRLTNK